MSQKVCLSFGEFMNEFGERRKSHCDIYSLRFFDFLLTFSSEWKHFSFAVTQFISIDLNYICILMLFHILAHKWYILSKTNIFRSVVFSFSFFISVVQCFVTHNVSFAVVSYVFNTKTIKIFSIYVCVCMFACAFYLSLLWTLNYL